MYTYDSITREVEMTDDKQLAINVFGGDTTAGQTPAQQPTTQTPATQNETEAPATVQNTQTQATQQVLATTDTTNSTYFIYGGIVIGLFILLALIIIIRKLSKAGRKGA